MVDNTIEKTKRKSGVKRLLELAGNAKPYIALSCLLSVLSALVSLGPYMCVYFTVRNIDPLDWAAMQRYGWAAVVFVAAQFLLYFAALMCSHIAMFKTTRNIKSRLLKHLVMLPMGFHVENPSGKLRKIIENNVMQAAGCIAPLPDLIAAIITPLAAMMILLSVDWRLGLLCLIPVVFGIALQASMMPGGKEKSYLDEYQNALEDMNNQAVEYVRGISVVKVFGQTIYSFKNFLAAIKRYEEYSNSTYKQST
jgi:ATP-binding cassette subfamily B protein